MWNFRQPNLLPIPWKGRCFYMAAEAWSFPLPNGDIYETSPGVIVDLASVPRMFWSKFPPDGLYRAGVFAHDICYGLQGRLSETHYVSRAQSDKILFELSLLGGMTRRDAQLMYDGVKYFGHKSWRKSTGKLTYYNVS
jgi:hypothetical protein